MYQYGLYVPFIAVFDGAFCTAWVTLRSWQDMEAALINSKAIL
jgi:hypothetical protein